MRCSVKTKITAAVLAVFAAAAAVYSYFSYSSAKRSAEAVVTSLIDQSAASAAETLSGKIEAVTAVCDDLSGNDAAFNRAVDEIRLRLLDMRNENYVAEGMTFDIAYSDELVSIDGVTDYRGNEAVRSAAAGTPLMTAPFQKDGKTVVCYASPLSEPYGDRRCVLVCMVCCGFFDDVFDVISLGESCSVYVSDENGIVAGEPSEAENVYSASSPVENRAGWTVTVGAVPDELIPDLAPDIFRSVGFTAVLAVIISAVVSVILNKNLNPLKKMADRIYALADGDFTSPIPKAASRESRMIAEALDSLLSALHSFAAEITALTSGGRKNGTADTAVARKGELASVYAAVSDMKRSVGEILSQVQSISDSVMADAEKLTDKKMKSVRTQSFSLKGISADDIFTVHTDISECADRVSDSVGSVKEKLREERGKLSELAGTLSDVNSYADDIYKVISQIEEIAFRTNILALNAAVEASAAGEHGRSFAVVADEVRALAQRSSEAAKSTEVLIKKTVSALSGGASLAKESAAALDEAAERTETTGRLTDDIRSASAEYAAAAGSAKEALSRLAEETEANAASCGLSAEESEVLAAIADSARRLRSVTDSFGT